MVPLFFLLEERKQRIEMIKEIKELVHTLYNERISKVIEINRIFCDYYGEGRVDLQGVLSESDLISSLESHNIGDFISTSSVLDFYKKSRSTEDIEIVGLLLREGAFEENVLSDRVLAKYFLPVIFERKFTSNPFILVHFPEVRVTNEYGKFTDLKDLWVKVHVKYSGQGYGFSINRSSYSLMHLHSNYMHSHIMNIPFDSLTTFMPPCLGTGPIRSTIATLAIEYDPSIWQLLCLEIDRYVHTESVSGVPYHQLGSLGANGTRYKDFQLPYRRNEGNRLSISWDNSTFSGLWRGFMRHLLNSDKLKFNYKNGSYGLAFSFSEVVLLISNEFISYYNSRPKDERMDRELRNHNLITECFIVDGDILIKGSLPLSSDNYTRYIGKLVCTFKGRDITFKITDLETPEDTQNVVRILNLAIIEKIIYSILRVVNEKYGKDRIETSEASAPTRYL